MTTLDRLDEWKAVGTITQAQYDTLAAMVRKESVSVYVELSAGRSGGAGAGGSF